MTAPAPGLILRVWLGIGIQSFGGGVATLALIRKAAVEQYGWITEEEFTRDWAICQVAPGINLIALAILLGRKLGGAREIALTLLGLLLPSAAATIAISAGFASIHGLPAVQAILRGVIPATVGLGLLTGYQMARPLIAQSWREGRGSLTISVTVLMGSGAAVAMLHAPVLAVLAGGAGLSAAAMWLRTRRDGDER